MPKKYTLRKPGKKNTFLVKLVIMFVSLVEQYNIDSVTSGYLSPHGKHVLFISLTFIERAAHMSVV